MVSERAQHDKVHGVIREKRVNTQFCPPFSVLGCVPSAQLMKYRLSEICQSRSAHEEHGEIAHRPRSIPFVVLASKSTLEKRAHNLLSSDSVAVLDAKISRTFPPDRRRYECKVSGEERQADNDKRLNLKPIVEHRAQSRTASRRDSNRVFRTHRSVIVHHARIANRARPRLSAPIPK